MRISDWSSDVCSSDLTSLPDVISTASQPEWTRDVEQFDVVVVGFGISGGCAALEAARSGGRVVLLERAAIHGGTSSMSGGAFYLEIGRASCRERVWQYV